MGIKYDPVLGENREADLPAFPEGGVTKEDLAAEVQASLDLADSAYQLPENGIPSDDLTEAAQGLLSGAYQIPETGVPLADLDTDVQNAITSVFVKAKTLQLRGTVQTPVAFQSDTEATALSDNAETYDLTGVGNGGTLIFNTDAAGVQTATYNFAAAKSVSGATPSLDISAGVDNKFMLSVNGDDAEEVELTLANCDTGANIAAEMQTQIQALGGEKTAVTVDYNVTTASKYTILSGVLGTSSAVVVTPANLNNITEELKIGTDSGGVETAGTGDVANAAVVTTDEIATVIAADCNKLNAADDGNGAVQITSKTDGKGSSILVGNGTLNTVVGFTNADLFAGAQGLDYDADMADANYIVTATIKGIAGASLADLGLSITDQTSSGFNIECETAASEAYVNLIIAGESA